MEYLFALIITILGGFIGALFASIFTKRIDKNKLTLEFHKEFNGIEMAKHRRIADDCIKRFPDADYIKLQELDYEGSLSAIIVLRFFQRFWQCAKAEELNDALAANLFLDIFLFWYCISYKLNLMNTNRNWIAKTDMPELYNWLLDKCTVTNATELIDANKQIREKRIETYKQSVTITQINPF